MLKYFFLSWRFNQFAKNSEWFQQCYTKGLELAQKSDRPPLYKAYINNCQRYSVFKENMAYDMFRFLNQTQNTWQSLKSWIPGTQEFKVRKKIAEALSNAQGVFKKIFIQYLYLDGCYSDRKMKFPKSSLEGCSNVKKRLKKQDIIPCNKKQDIHGKKIDFQYNNFSSLPHIGFWR